MPFGKKKRRQLEGLFIIFLCGIVSICASDATEAVRIGGVVLFAALGATAMVGLQENQRIFDRARNGNAEAFQSVLRMLYTTYWPKDVRRVAQEFQVADSTVERWCEGTAKPHPHLQGMVVDYIQRQYA